MNKPKISIIIPTWNTATVTQRCVQTITKNLSSDYYEIIVVDNGSTDNTSELITQYKSVKYVKLPTNLGFSKACNIGANNSHSDLLLFLNSDMELIDNSLMKMVDFYYKQSHCGAIGPQFLFPDGKIQGSVFPEQSIINSIKEYWFGQKTYSKYTPSSSHASKVWGISGGAILIQKSLFNQIGGWSEKYFMYYEDLDLCQKIHRLKYDIFYFPDTKIIHHHGLSGKNLTEANNQWRRLIPSSIIYHGKLKHYLLFLIIWTSQKWRQIFSRN